MQTGDGREPGLGRLDLLAATGWAVLAVWTLTPVTWYVTKDVASAVNLDIHPALAFLRVGASIFGAATLACLTLHLARRRPPRAKLTALERAVLTCAAGLSAPALAGGLLAVLGVPARQLGWLCLGVGLVTPFLVAGLLCRHRRAWFAVGMLHAVGLPFLVLLGGLLTTILDVFLDGLGVSISSDLLILTVCPLALVANVGVVYLQYWVEDRE